MEFIVCEVKDKVGWLTLNNPAKRNSLNPQLIAELISTLDRLKGEKVPVVVLRAQKGSKVWSAGYDINVIHKDQHDPLGYDSPMEQVLRAIQHYPGPIIAMVEGSVWGGACDMAVTCDMIIGAPSCSFAITPVKIGLPYNASGIMHFINRVGLNIAKEMFFSARSIESKRALEVGLLNHLVPEDKLEAFTAGIADQIASFSTLSISVIKEQFRILSNAHPINPDGFERIQGLRRRVYNSHDYHEGVQAFLEKRKPQFKGE